MQHDQVQDLVIPSTDDGMVEHSGQGILVNPSYKASGHTCGHNGACNCGVREIDGQGRHDNASRNAHGSEAGRLAHRVQISACFALLCLQ